jgi:thiosulfate dehydrogenase (quinone) large subunit
MDTAKTVWTVTRVSLGLIFLWAFIDKLLGLGFATCRDKTTGQFLGVMCDKAWLAGGSPTAGFLKGAKGTFGALFNGLAGLTVIDWLFMIGLLCIGIALIFGVALGITAISGTVLMVLMWLAALPLPNHPVLDDHIIYAMLLWGFFVSGMHGENAIARWWSSLGIVQRNKILQ